MESGHLRSWRKRLREDKAVRVSFTALAASLWGEREQGKVWMEGERRAVQEVGKVGRGVREG